MVSTDGGLLNLDDSPIEGYETRQEAIEAWLADTNTSSDDFMITPDGDSAWIFREDGTAQALVDFLRGDGYLVHGYTKCAS